MIEMVIESRKKDLGGFEVGRILPFAKRRMVGPFVFLDHMGPAEFAPGQAMDVRPHPHIGLSTVTYLFEGEIIHRDNLGVTQAIVPGEVNWMTAGRGIVHSERTDQAKRPLGGRMHGMQAWVALPNDSEEVEPAFHHHDEADLPTYRSGGLWARLIAGEAFGARAAVKTFSPLFYVHWEMEAGTVAGLPPEHEERAAYVVRGEIETNGQKVEAGNLVVFEKGGQPTVKALSRATVMLLGGAPVGERHIWWNFVHSSKDRIAGAAADWKAGRFPLPAHDAGEFIPLPEDAPPASPPEIPPGS